MGVVIYKVFENQLGSTNYLKLITSRKYYSRPSLFSSPSPLRNAATQLRRITSHEEFLFHPPTLRYVYKFRLTECIWTI